MIMEEGFFFNAISRRMNPIKDRKILLGVSGGVGAFKACELLRLFVKAGAQVRVILTEAAGKFVTPLSFSALGAESVSVDMFEVKRESLEHVSWADWSDLLVIAPATANIIGKMANGIADEILSTQAVAYDGPILLAPAMNVKMYNNKAVQRNIAYLRTTGIQFIGPETGRLASLITAAGRMVEPEAIFAGCRQMLLGRDDLSGKKIVVTAGPTQEPLDPVRYLSNQSSGKMGYALADAAAGFGGKVVLISGPVTLTPPPAVETVPIRTAAEMQRELRKHCRGADYLYMAAAVADFTPAGYYKQKIRRSDKRSRIDIKSVPDLLKSLGRSRPEHVIGFALETENLEARALEKMRSKRIDMIVANNPTEKGMEFGSDYNKITIFSPGGKKQAFEMLPKFEVAVNIIEQSLKLKKKRGQKTRR
jgi:phosphopantothenoylcysteine decarboxylase/phosphopantothenate--cysteine ligase